MIVPFDLARDEKGKVIVGPETKIACDRAIELAQEDSKSLIVCTAGVAGEKWDHSWMALIIGEYVLGKVGKDRFLAGKTFKFNTWGEMEELSNLSSRWKWKLSNLEIVLVVKWWHAPRAKFLCKYFFKGYPVKITVNSCESFVSYKTIISEFLLAWPINILRVIRDFF